VSRDFLPINGSPDDQYLNLVMNKEILDMLPGVLFGQVEPGPR
jgi:hypothetical protein